VSNFRFVPQIFGGAILLPTSKIAPQNGCLRTRCGGHCCCRSVQALAHILCYVPLMGSCSQVCLIMHPRRVAVPFPPTFSSPHRKLCSNPCQNNFVEGKIWDHPSNMTQKEPKLEGHFMVQINSPLGNRRFPMNMQGPTLVLI